MIMREEMSNIYVCSYKMQFLRLTAGWQQQTEIRRLFKTPQTSQGRLSTSKPLNPEFKN